MMVVLHWVRYSSFISARDATGRRACIYAQTDRDGYVLRVGMTSDCLAERYKGGTGYALDAAMHGSGNLFYVAQVPTELRGDVKEFRKFCEAIEGTLIWTWRAALPYNNNGKLRPPAHLIALRHDGDPPLVRGSASQGGLLGQLL